MSRYGSGQVAYLDISGFSPSLTQGQCRKQCDELQANVDPASSIADCVKALCAD